MADHCCSNNVIHRHSLVAANDDDNNNNNNNNSNNNGTTRNDAKMKQKNPKKHTPPRRFRNYEKVNNSDIISQTDDNNNTTLPLEDVMEQIDSTIKCYDYIAVIIKYPYYRNFLLAHLCMHMGDWFVRVASLLMVEELSPKNSDGKSLAMLALTSLLPQAIFSQVGGFLSDSYDRRILMIGFDVAAGIVVLGYLLAIHYKSLDMLFFVSTARSAISSTYYPIAHALVPLLVPDVRDLQLATTLNSWAWCTMAILGGTVAGTATAYIGLQACYIIDSVTFFTSALSVLLGISGSYCVAEDRGNERRTCYEGLCQIANHFGEVFCYLWKSGFGSLIFLKASATIIWGAEDIVGAEFAKVDGNEDQSSMNMGILFSTIGLGCFLGPLLVNTFTDANRPITVQRTVWISFLILTFGWLSISRCQTFPQFLFATMVRTMGSGIAWPYTTLILQTLSDKEILGRVLSVDYTVARLTEALSAQTAGALSQAGFSKQELALFGASLGLACSIFWGIYHFVFRQGAAQARFNNIGGNDPIQQQQNDAFVDEHDVIPEDSNTGIELPPSLEKDLKLKELEIL